MKPERFKRTKSVMASSAIALVAAALVIGVSSFLIGPGSASSQRSGFDLTSGSSSFNITSNVYASPACSGPSALLYPGKPRCLVFTVQNSLTVPITVQSITTTLDTTDYAAPPDDCAGSNLTLPTFSGSLTVAGGGSANSPGVPIELKDDGAPQNDCESYTYHFTYSGSAQYTDSTSTALTAAPNPSTSGQSVTLTATVTAANPSTDASLPSGTVSFYSCPTSTPCAGSSSNLLGSGTIGTGGKATFSTSTLSVGTTYIEAVYPASGTNFSSSTSNVVAQVVNTSTTKSTSSSLTSSSNPSNYGSSVTFTDTVTGTAGTPTGSVTFYSCTGATTCSTTKVALGGAVTLSSGKATFATSILPVGTTYVEAIYGGSGTYSGSTSNVVSQSVKAVSTSTALTSSPNPSLLSSPVTLTATVTGSSGTATPSGTVTFHLGSATGSVLGSASLNGSAQAAITTSSLPAGTDNLYAVYAGSIDFTGSTSPDHVQTVFGLPIQCSGSYPNVVYGNPIFPIADGTNGGDFIYAFGADYWINGFNGNDCIDAGDGSNLITDGDGNDAVVAGNGNNTVIVGNGNDTVSLGNGADEIAAGNGNDTITVGNGSTSGVIVGNGSDAVTVGNGSDGQITVGNGSDTITVGTGSYNGVRLGGGTDTVTIHGSHDDIEGGAGNETIYLGSGTYNAYNGQAHHTNTCHLPLPPSSYHGTTAAYYHDTITNCTVVSP